MNILVLNAGSSSLKFGLFRFKEPRTIAEEVSVLARGQIERIGGEKSQIKIIYEPDGAAQCLDLRASSVSEAAHAAIQHLTTATTHGQELFAIDVVGHRIVHGGAKFFEPTIVDDLVLNELRSLNDLAPLHNPSGIAGVEATKTVLPSVTNVLVFDTAFHHTLPPVAARYALPAELSDRLQLRRYGFHGISYRFVSGRLKKIFKDNTKQDSRLTRVIICHLGNGASVCALRNGKSIDTSMGFTPLEGLVMGTRSGDVDPGLLLHLLRKEKMTIEQVESLLNYQSGMLGISGICGDSRDLERSASEGHRPSQLALESFAYRVRKYIGSYAAVLGGLDTLVFTGGIGQHSAMMRSRICHDLEFLNIHLDQDRNQKVTGGQPAAISKENLDNIWVVPTDEEYQIACESYAYKKGTDTNGIKIKKLTT